MIGSLMSMSGAALAASCHLHGAPGLMRGRLRVEPPPTNLPPPGQAGQCLGNMGCRLRRGKRRGRQEGAVLMGTASLAPRMWPYSVATARGSCTAGAEPGFLEELE